MGPISDESEIVDLTRTGNTGRVKPNMRLDSNMLQGSGLVRSLPDFIERLARSNRELKMRVAGTGAGAGAGAGFELTEEEAASQPHIEMDVYAGVIEDATNQPSSGIILPTKGNDEQEDDGNVSDASGRSEDSASDTGRISPADDEDVSSPPGASQATNPNKRKASSLLNSESASTPPSKTRVTVERASPTPSAASSTSHSSGSSVGSTRIIRIKVPGKSQSPDDSDSNASSPSSPGRKIIRLKDPRSGASPQPARQSTPTGVIKLKVPEAAPSEEPKESEKSASKLYHHGGNKRSPR
ncbi:hypothetical protein GQ53DRAFT_765435 [Thozetella sp. PMI_491]|nr:hypothetical protein GQ53DRAFT_765435 [Thozetella sp. PMI_491]